MLILLCRKELYTDQIQELVYNDDNRLESIVFDQSEPDTISIETRSTIFPLVLSQETCLQENKPSSEVEAKSVSQFTSSLDPHSTHCKMQKFTNMDSESGLSSGYVGFNQENDLRLNEHMQGILSTDDLNMMGLQMVDLQSLRESACSPESHVLSIGDSTANVSECDTAVEGTLLQSSRLKETTGNGTISPTLASTVSDRQEEKDSGFPTTDSDCPIPMAINNDMLGESLVEPKLAHHSHITDDSGYPFEYSEASKP